jgi:tetratricopeptide (TPR) repeat protein
VPRIAAPMTSPPSSTTLSPDALEKLRAIRQTLQAGDVAAAAASAETVLAAGVRHPFLFNTVAMHAETMGRLAEAETHLRLGLDLSPDDTGCLHALGLLLLRLERPDEAKALFERVIERHPQFAPALVGLGQALESVGELLAAEARYAAALAVEPANLLARAGLASVHGRRGERARARELGLAVLAAEPNYPPAAMLVAEAEIGDGDTAGAERRVRALLAESRLSPVERSLALGILGDALDRAQRPAEAFAAYHESNEMRRRHYAPEFSGRRTLDYASELRDWFRRHGARDLVSVVPPEVSNSPASGHAFLLGFPRSGTTLLEQILASHPRVTALEERETLIDAVRAFMRSPGDLARLGLAGEAELEPLRAAYWKRVADAGVFVNRNLFIDKYPLNGLKLPLIARLFPEARILFALRDPRDVVWSCYRRRFRMNASMYEFLSLETAARLYDAVMEVTELLIRDLELRVQRVKLEALIADFENEARGLCAFLDLPWSEGMRDFAATARARGVATPSGSQLARGLNSSGIGEWRRYREQLAPVLPVLAPWVERFGYAAD